MKSRIRNVEVYVPSTSEMRILRKKVKKLYSMQAPFLVFFQIVRPTGLNDGNVKANAGDVRGKDISIQVLSVY